MIPPEILIPPPPRKELKPTDVTDFPQQQVVPIPEDIHYPEGKYRPPTLPYRSSFYPIQLYLEKGKIYKWCSCGASWSDPWCDHKCHYQLTRCRPIIFNVDKSGYYTLCACKQSANAPFCNGTHKVLVKNFNRSYFGKYRNLSGWGLFAFLGYCWWNFKS